MKYRFLLALCAAGLVTGGAVDARHRTPAPAADAAQAVPRGTFTVSSTRVVLSEKVRSVLLQVRSDAEAPLSIGVELLKWDQNPEEGELVLNPTNDVVFFPKSFTLQPGEVRNIRIGTTIAPGGVERSYRLIVQENARAAAPGQAAGISFRLRQSLPVFVMPEKLRPEARLQGVSFADGGALVSVANTGNVHGMISRVTVRGLADTGGATVFEAGRPGWYLLPGRALNYRVDMPAADCAKARALAVEVQVSDATLKQELPLPAGACAAGPRTNRRAQQ